MSERIFEKTVKITERPFTTEPKHYIKRGSHTIRARCIEYVQKLGQLGFTLELPLETAQQLFTQTLDIWDRTSLKAYFGTLPGQSKRTIRRWARYQSGTTSVKDIQLSQETRKCEGYLEKLGLVTYGKKGCKWFLILEKPFLVPTLLNEGSGSSNDKISLTFSQGEESEKPIWEGVSAIEAEESNVLLATQQTHTLQGEREISRVKVKVIPHSTVELSSEEQAILNAKPRRNDDKLERALGHKP